MIMLEVGSYFHVPTEAIGRNPVRWLFDTYEVVQRAKYQKSMAHIAEVELATLRALVQFHSKKKRRLPPLPTYEQSMMAEETQPTIAPGTQKPAWMLKYEEANKRLKSGDEDGKDPPGTDG